MTTYSTNCDKAGARFVEVMSLKLQQARAANQRTKDLTNGYIRSQHKNTAIPMVINYICLLYYLMKDRFGKHGKVLKISSSKPNSEDYDVVEGHESPCVWATVYGTVDVNINKNVFGSWTFKLDCANFAIGIINITDLTNLDMTTPFLCFGRASGAHYAWYGCGDLMSNEEYQKSEIQFDKGDIIKMEFNLSRKTLKFYKNDKDVNLEFIDVDLTPTYRLAISTFNKAKLQMIDS